MKSQLLHFFLAIFTFCVPLSAVTINFEAQGASAPSAFTGVPNSPFVVGIATFTGGQLLNKEVSAIDVTAVYATATVGKLADPLTITFSQPVSAFSLLLTNAVADTYVVSDDKGGSQSLAVNQNTSQLFSLPDPGITSVSILSTITVPFWNFAIDDVTFTPAAVVNTVPEPATLPVAGLLLVCSLLARKRLQLRGLRPEAV